MKKTILAIGLAAILVIGGLVVCAYYTNENAITVEQYLSGDFKESDTIKVYGMITKTGISDGISFITLDGDVDFSYSANNFPALDDFLYRNVILELDITGTTPQILSYEVIY